MWEFISYREGEYAERLSLQMAAVWNEAIRDFERTETLKSIDESLKKIVENTSHD